MRVKHHDHIKEGEVFNVMDIPKYKPRDYTIALNPPFPPISTFRRDKDTDSLLYGTGDVEKDILA